ncbi:MAG: 4Fe-4S dicluster domain-containing protein, partial [Desulfobacterales bacterium]|nr:4Fe-4S dicluster domain-containing protein [Desulfobacterales bacterium]
PGGGIAVIISRHPCLINDRDGAVPAKIPVVVNDKCDLCGFCHDRFECPALYKDRERERTRVNPILCTQCGVCLQVCPKGALEAQ